MGGSQIFGPSFSGGAGFSAGFSSGGFSGSHWRRQTLREAMHPYRAVVLDELAHLRKAPMGHVLPVRIEVIDAEDLNLRAELRLRPRERFA